MQNDCQHRLTAAQQTPCNHNRIELIRLGPQDRCLLRPPSTWPAGFALRWIASGGETTVFGLCLPKHCPHIETPVEQQTASDTANIDLALAQVPSTASALRGERG